MAMGGVTPSGMQEPIHVVLVSGGEQIKTTLHGAADQLVAYATATATGEQGAAISAETQFNTHLKNLSDLAGTPQVSATQLLEDPEIQAAVAPVVATQTGPTSGVDASTTVAQLAVLYATLADKLQLTPPVAPTSEAAPPPNIPSPPPSDVIIEE
jgi:hypothetical protein